MISKKVGTALGGAALLAAVTILPAIATEHASDPQQNSETGLGLLIQTPDTPHGISFTRQMT
ncbi:MAG: hypothetical protein AAGF86_10325 [Pseudomonadota bacterium]